MPIIPTVHGTNARRSVRFHTTVLDFERVGGEESPDDPTCVVLAREGHQLILSSHGGDRTRDFYVGEPDGNTLRCIQGW